jgi:hypothetical protein
LKKSIFITCLTLCFVSAGASSQDAIDRLMQKKKPGRSIFDKIFEEEQKKKKCPGGVLDQLLDEVRRSLFVCDKGVFSKEVKFELMFKACEGYFINDKPLDAIPPWLFHSVSKNDDKEELLVIKDDLSSVAYVTREKSFSRNKGYTWSEDKFYCEIERVE